MPRSINVATVRTNFIADTQHFEAGVRRAVDLQGRFTGSLLGTAQVQQRHNATATQFLQSIRSTIIATAAYTVGVDLSRRALLGSVQAALEWDRGLIQVAKTADLTDREVVDLSDSLRELLTVGSALGERQPLPVDADDLLRIAEVAGQMRIQGVPDIQAFTETVALLTLTTDLSGDAAANALGKVIALTDALPEQSLALGSAITALGNQVRGGEREILNQAQSIAAATSLYELSARTLLGLSAVFAQAGTQAESAGTVIQRTLQALANATEQQVALIANAARVSRDEVQEAIDTGDREQQLRLFVRALSRLPETAQEGSAELTQAAFLRSIFGEANVRITRILGVLARDEQEFLRILQLSNDSFEERTALTDEASRAAERYRARLEVVGNALEDQGRKIGDSLLPPLTAVAEQFRLIEILAVGAGAAIGSHFLLRRGGPVQRAQAGIVSSLAARGRSREILLQAERQRDAAAIAQRQAQGRALAFARQPVTSPGAVGVAEAQRLRDPGGPLFLQSTVGEANRRYAQATRENTRLATERATALNQARRASDRLAVSERRLANVTARLGGRFGVASIAARAFSGVVGFLGGPIGILTTGLTVALTALALFPEETRRAARGTAEFFRQLGPGRGARDVVALTREAESLQELADAVTLLNEAEAALGEGPTGGRSGRAGRARAIAEIRERREEIQEVLRLATDENALSEAEARVAEIGARLAEIPAPVRRSRVRGPQDRDEFADERGRLEAERTRLQGFIDAAGRAPTELATPLDEIRERFNVTFGSIADAIDEGGTAAREFFDGIRNADIGALERALFAAEQARRAEGPDRAERFEFERGQQVAERVRALDSEIARISTQRAAVAEQEGTLAALFDRLGEGAESELGTANFEALKNSLDEAEKAAADLEERLARARQERDALLAGEDGGRGAEIARAEFDVARADIDRAFRTRDTEGSGRTGRLRALEIEASLTRQIASAIGDVAIEEAKLLSPEQAIQRSAALELQTRVEAERLDVVSRIAQAEEALAAAEAERAAVGARLDAGSTLEDDLQRYRELTDAVARYTDELAEGNATLEGLDAIPLDQLTARLTAILVHLRDVRVAADRPIAAALREQLIQLGDDGQLVFENLSLAVEDWALRSGNAFGDTLTDQLLSGEASWAGFADSVIRSLVRILVQAVIVQNILSALATAFPGAFGQTPNAVTAPQGYRGAPVLHSGGLVEQDAPRSPGLRHDERLAVLQVDEEVLARRDPRHRYNAPPAWLDHLPRFHSGGIVGVDSGARADARTSDVRIELVNESGTPLQAELDAPEFDAEGMVQRVILSDVNRRGPITQALRPR